MDDKKILEIIKEEIEKVYGETEILSSFPELKEAVLKFNRLVDEGFDDAQKIYDKIFKYSISDTDKMSVDKEKIDEIIEGIKEISNQLKGYAYNSQGISDDEQIEVEGMYESVNKYLYSLESISNTLSNTINKYEEAKEEMANEMRGVSVLHSPSNFKIFVN